MTTQSRPSVQEVNRYMETLSNWGRWGPNDELGTMNYVTPEKRIAAAKLVRKGITVSCSRMLYPEIAADVISSPLHFMQGVGNEAPEKGMGGATDFIGLAFHGYHVTHIDTFSHIFWKKFVK